MYDIIEASNKSAELVLLLEELLGDARKHYESRSQISFDCPNCSANKGVEYDGKGNLEINYELGVYNCWSCGETDNTKGRIYNLFKEYADKDLLKRFISGKFQFNSEFYVDQVKTIDKPKVKLPDGYFSLVGKENPKNYPMFKNAFNYLYSRGITDEIINKFNIGFCYDGLYQNRVVIPSYDINNTLNYFVTRSISPWTKKNKYLNCNDDKTQIIFNEKFINWDKPIRLVEGPFDHLPTPNSITLLGKKMYSYLFDKLYFNAKSYIIIVLDPDAYDDAIKIYNKLNAGKLRDRILINWMPEDYDVSKFNEVFGNTELLKWLKTKNYKLND